MNIEEDDYDSAEGDTESIDINETDSVAGDLEETDSSDESSTLNDVDLAEAESLTVTAKQSIRQQLEDEVARFLAQGGKITEVPPDEAAHH